GNRKVAVPPLLPQPVEIRRGVGFTVDEQADHPEPNDLSLEPTRRREAGLEPEVVPIVGKQLDGIALALQRRIRAATWPPPIDDLQEPLLGIPGAATPATAPLVYTEVGAMPAQRTGLTQAFNDRFGSEAA